MKNILEIHNLNKSYQNRQIIKDLNFVVPEKSIVAIVGKSGSGKSTVLNMIGLLETIDSGTIKIRDEILPKINSVKATQLRRNMINYLFQSYALINDISVMDNLLIAMEFVKESKKIKLQKIKKVLQDLGILPLKNKIVNTLSGGEQQRVALARCVLKPGDLILADEPTGSLDPQMSQVVFEMIKELRDTYHKSVIVVTHDMEIAQKADTIIELETIV